MSASLRRLVTWMIPAGLLAGALVYAFQPQPVDVDLVTVARGPLIASVTNEGETRIKDVFVVSAPIMGRALRTEMEEGDPVQAFSTVLAEIEPIDPAFLDVRSEAEAQAMVDASRAALAQAEAALAEARAELDFATSEVDRTRTLRASNTVSARALEDAERLYRTREAAVGTATATVGMRLSELRAAELRVLQPTANPEGAGACPCVPIMAPVDGTVLRILQESEAVVQPGDPLIEVGNPADLEIVADFLSTDAVRIQPGARVLIENWGGPVPINGTVRRIDPFGFTKISALGIEEQRVNVLIDLTDPHPVWDRLGHGFQVDARVVLWEGRDVLHLPLTAVFRARDGDGGAGADQPWVVFAVEDGRAALRPVRLGHGNDLEVQILSGLEEGDQVVLFPNDSIIPGVQLRQR